MSAAVLPSRGDPQLSLSPRQYEVAVLLRAGLARPEIARQLGIGSNTVKTLTTAVYRALGVQSRQELERVSFSSWPARRCETCGMEYAPVRQAQRFCSGSGWCARIGAASTMSRPGASS